MFFFFISVRNLCCARGLSRRSLYSITNLPDLNGSEIGDRSSVRHSDLGNTPFNNVRSLSKLYPRINKRFFLFNHKPQQSERL